MGRRSLRAVVLLCAPVSFGIQISGKSRRCQHTHNCQQGGQFGEFHSLSFRYLLSAPWGRPLLSRDGPLSAFEPKWALVVVLCCVLPRDPPAGLRRGGWKLILTYRYGGAVATVGIEPPFHPHVERRSKHHAAQHHGDLVERRFGLFRSPPTRQSIWASSGRHEPDFDHFLRWTRPGWVVNGGNHTAVEKRAPPNAPQLKVIDDWPRLRSTSAPGEKTGASRPDVTGLGRRLPGFVCLWATPQPGCLTWCAVADGQITISPAKRGPSLRAEILRGSGGRHPLRLSRRGLMAGTNLSTSAAGFIFGTRALGLVSATRARSLP